MGAGPEQEALRATAARFLAKGHPVTTISADDILTQPRRSAKVSQPASSVPGPVESTLVAAVDATSTMTAPSLAVPIASKVPAFSQELRLVQVDASREPARFWLLQWHPTLFAGMALVEVQGRIGRHARARVLLQMESPLLDIATEQLVRRRLQQGYQLVDWS